MGKIRASSTPVSRDAPDLSCPLEWAQFCHAKLPSHRKILLTGATGRLGSHVLAALLARKEHVRAIVRPGSKSTLPRGVERFVWDLSSDPLPHTAFVDVDRVIHLAGLVGSRPLSELMLSNTVATRNLVSSCPQKLSKLVVASSISIYGEYKGQTVNEEFKPRTESPYGKSKLASEEEVRAHRRGIPTALLRFGMIYGPGFEEGYFTVFAQLQKGKMTILGDGKNRVPLVQAIDVVQAILLALDSNASSGREYNIVGGETPTQEEVIRLAAEALNVPAPTSHTPVLLAKLALSLQSLVTKPKFNSEHLRQLALDRAYSASRAKEELGFSPQVKLKDGIKEMAMLYKAKNQEQYRCPYGKS